MGARIMTIGPSHPSHPIQNIARDQDASWLRRVMSAGTFELLEMRGAHLTGFARAAQERRSDLVGRVMSLEALRRDGRKFPVELTISVWTTGEEVTFTGLVRDMSAITVERPQ